MIEETPLETDQAIEDSFSLSQWGRGAIDLFRAPKTRLRSMTKEGGYGKPIVYALVWQYVASAVTLLLSFVRPVPTPWGIPGKILMFGVTPPLMLLVGFVIAAFFFVIWHLMGSSHNYQTAFRFWALLAPLAVLSAVPYLSLVVVLFYFFLVVTASVEIHAIRPTKAWTVWGILLAVFALLVISAGVISAARGRFPSSRGGGPIAGASSGLGFPSTPGGPDQTMSPEELQNNLEGEMTRAKEAFDRVKKESQAARPAQKKENPKK
jgi:hypothetical protein